jgi:hypothetical protein
MDAYLCLLGCAELGKRIEKLPSESKKKEKKKYNFLNAFLKHSERKSENWIKVPQTHTIH